MNTRRLMVASMALIGMLAPRAGAESYTTNIVDGVTNCVAGNYYVGDAGPFNRLIVTNAGVLDVSLTSGIGHRINGDNNIAIVTGTGSIWAAGLDFTVGKWSSGNRLIVSNGASVRLSNDNNAFFLGSAYKNVFAGDNRVLVTGPGSTLLLPRSFYLGYNDTLGFGGGTSNNSLTIADGAVVTNRSTTGSVSCHIRIGYLFTECTTPADTSSNAVTVTGAGSRWYIYNTKQLANEFYLGHDCPANSLNISAGGQVIMAGTNGNLLMAGYYAAASNNTITVSGTNSLLDIQSGEIHLGEFASGNRLIIQNGGVVSNVTGYLGGNNSGPGNLSANNAATITGGGALWNNSGNLYLGYATGSTNNQLTISDGGQVNCATGYVGYGTNTASGVVTITGSGALWNNSADLWIACGVGASNSQFTIGGGGRVNNANATIGTGGGNNTLVISGSNSLWNCSGAFTLGEQYGGNQLTVTNHATVSVASNCYLGYGSGIIDKSILFGDGATVSVGGASYVGYGSGADSHSILVTGPGTVWTNAGELAIGWASRTNSLVISNGATVASGIGSTSRNGGGNNSVLVTGNNSAWNIGNWMSLGGYDQLTISGSGAVMRVGGNMTQGGGGQLAITNGGQLIIGGYFRAQNAQDVILVTGPGSVWSNSGAFNLGRNFGDNQMIVANGGVIVSADALIGKGSSSSVITSNSVLVTGSGSRWNISGNLTEAGGSYQTVTVSNGGVVQVSGNVLVGTVSGDTGNKIVVASGSLTATNAGAGALTIGSGGGMTLNGGAVKVNQLTTSGAMTFQLSSPTSNGTLAVGGTAQLGGTLNVTNINSFVPAPPNSFTLLTASTVTGQFAATNLPPLAPDLEWKLAYSPTSAVLSVVNGGPAYNQWSQAHIPDPAQRGSDQNPDNDAFNNWQEYVADTDPTNSASFFRVTNMTHASPIAAYFESSTGRVYTMQGVTDLANGIWTNVPGSGPRMGVGGADSMTDTNEPTAGPFYRMKVNLP